MGNNYYFLVSGLPDLILDEGKNIPSFSEFMMEVEEQVSSGDLELLRCVCLPLDNSNLIKVLQNSKEEFDPRGNFTRDQITSAIKSGDGLPEYMLTFLEDYKENRLSSSPLIAQDQLNCYFYEHMIAHPNQFIREWFTFELNLRNLIVGINSRRGFEHFDALASERQRAVAAVLIGVNDEAEMISRSNAPDFGLSSQLPWAERVINLSRSTLLEFEKGIDLLRWDMLNELTIFTYFGIETIIAFSIKLLMVERWKKLDAQTGKVVLERLVEELQSAYSVPADF
jgi:hypothetical protein